MTDRPTRGASKREWRRWARRTRETADPAARSAEVCRALEEWGGLAGVVLAFLPLPDEIDLRSVFSMPGARFAVTRTPPTGPLTIHPVGSELETHRLGFSQPVEGADTIPYAAVDVALVPGLAFDRSGRRLGRGAGYYDALLSRLRAEVPRVGVAVDALVVEELPVDPWDAAMTHLATESGVRPVSSPRAPAPGSAA